MMADEPEANDAIQETEHQAAYIYNPNDDDLEGAARPSKKRKVSKKNAQAGTRGQHKAGVEGDSDISHYFIPLLNGKEDESLVRMRQKAFNKPWAQLENRIKKVLRDANHKTLDDVVEFIQTSPERISNSEIPAAFIITGAAMASQDLLYEQLSESLQSQADSLVVRLRSSDVSNLRSTLTKIIQNATSKGTTDDEDQELTTSRDGRKFLKYDLEALHVYLKTNERRKVVIVFQDSEGFDGGLLSDLIMLFQSWLDRIPFSLVFGVATSVELLQARLLKSTCKYLHGAQFDVEQSASIIDRVFKVAICHSDLTLRAGSSIAQTLLERQRDQVAGMSVLTESLKYLHMSHYYANPLSFLLAESAEVQMLNKEHIGIVRNFASFRRVVESAVEVGDANHAKQLLQDDEYLANFVMKTLQSLRAWRITLLRAVKLLELIQDGNHTFTELYLDALAHGSNPDSQDSAALNAIERLEPIQAIDLSARILGTIRQGDEALGLEGWENDEPGVVQLLEFTSTRVQELQSKTQENGQTLRSKHSRQAKVLRTTVVAQKVQLSRDTATLTEEDKEYTELLQRLAMELGALLQVEAAEQLPFHEIWLYDSKTPHKEVFVPRPRAVIERALSQPHDYLGCSCCRSGTGQLASTLPATAIVYQLYLETGSLINVADLWSAYHAIVGADNEGGLDERTALVLFYRALAELKTMGFVKQTRKKADHIAKLAWRGL